MTTNNEENVKEAVKQQVTGLLAEVADKVKSSAPEVFGRLRDSMVEKEVAIRVSKLDAAFASRLEMQQSLRKIDRPDQETYNADGTVATATYTKARLEEIKKVKEVLAKLETAMEKALSEGDFAKLKDFAK